MKINFAVCILSFNRFKYLKKTLRSFDKINFKSKNIFIFDDKSDFSKDKNLVKKNFSKYNFVINKKRLNLSANIGNLIKLKNFDYILLFEDHDLIHKEYFKIIENIIKKNNDFAFIVSERIYIDSNNKIIRRSSSHYRGVVNGNSYINNELSKFNFSHPLCVTINTKELNKKILTDVKKFRVYGDIYLWMSLAKNKKLYFCSKNLYYSREREKDHFLENIDGYVNSINEVSNVNKLFIKKNLEFNNIMNKCMFQFSKILKILFVLVSYRIRSKKKINLKYNSVINFYSLIINNIPIYILSIIKKLF